jgi:hypothetical protein
MWQRFCAKKGGSMNSLYNFLSGPLAWLAFILSIGASLYRLISLLVLVHKKEKFIYSYMSLKYGLRSILRWSTPFAIENMRRARYAPRSM